MITNRRAAEQLELALVAGRAPDTTTRAGRLTAELVGVATAVRSLPDPALAPSPAFRTALRTRLDDEAAQLSAARAALPTQRRAEPPATTVVRVGRKRQVLAGTVAAVLVSGTAAAVVSTSALPGDLLYPVKRSIEDVRAAVGTDAARGAAELGFARERLDEAEQLVLRAQTQDLGEAGTALADFGESADDGTSLLLEEYAEDGDATHLQEVQDFVVDVVPQLERLRTESPESLHPAIDALLLMLRGAAGDLDQTLAVCGAPCAGVSGLDVATRDLLDGAGDAFSGTTTATPATSAVPGVPDAPAAPGTPAPGDVEIADGTGVGVDDDGLVASVPGLTQSVPATGPASAGAEPPLSPPPLETSAVVTSVPTTLPVPLP